ncbi:rhodanese-like domain-containing protein [Afipia sp. Root123D2]|uniref:rhodanese-like domain-containing protein n=1 Tax=Afipia sp. Root123D2 TaxID=1736436 RepID=UPI00138ECC16|nr:rhodanese-like domain-containing protein [Afipia sp. Root123D2]
MAMQLRDKLKQAKELVPSIAPLDAVSRLGRDDVVFVDVRDLHELTKDGTIPGSVHVSRGALEFAIDPKSPAHKKPLSREVTFIVFCASGMRSLLAGQTMLEMGVKNVMSLEGGYTGWRKEGGPSTTASV